MAKKRKYQKRKGSASTIKAFAYRMGQVERGLANPNSQIAESHRKGKEAVTRNRKPLF